MFNKVIRESDLTLTRENSERAFPNIFGDDFRRDVSLIATLRALLFQRLGDGNSIQVRTNSMRYNRTDYDRNSVEAIFGATYTDRSDRWSNRLFITSIDSSADAVDVFMNKLSAGMKDMVNDIEELDDVTRYIEKKIRAKFFYSRSKKAAFIFAERLTTRTFHLINVFIPRYLPWFFEGKPLQPREKELLVSLSKTDPQRYLELIEEIASEFDIRSFTIKAMLGDFERRSYSTRLKSLREDVSRIEEEIRYNEESYRNLLNRLDTARINVAGLESMINTKKCGTEIMDLFLRQKNLEVLHASGNELAFNIRTYLTNFDPDMFERYRDNEDSFIWYNRNYSVAFDDEDDRRLLMNAIFSDEPLMRIKMCAYMNMDIRGRIDTESHRDFGRNYDDCIPNPHLNRHRCFGNHKPVIEELLRGGDIVAAIMQCIGSAGSVNVAEDVSFGPMLDELFTTENKVIELEDGTSVTPTEALNWLKNRE